MQLTIEPIWPLLRVVLAVAALVVLVLTTYPKRVRHLRPFDRRLLIGLRLTMVALLAIAMLRPVAHIRNEEPKKRFLLIITDRSQSMKTRDGIGLSGGNTRRQQLLKTLADCRNVLNDFGPNVTILFFDFAETLDDQIDSLDKLKNRTDGTETDIARAMTLLAAKCRKKNVIGVILLSDGAHRAAEKNSNVSQRERLKTSLKGFQKRGQRIHSVVFGRVGTGKSGGDLSIESISLKSDPFEGKVVTVRVNIRAVGARGRRLTARILLEQDAIAPGSGKMRPAKVSKFTNPENNNLVPDGDDVVLPQVELSFKPPRSGKLKIAVQIDGLRDETNTSNNIITRIIDVQSGGIRVAYFDRVRIEQKYLRKVSASDKIQLNFFRVRNAFRFQGNGRGFGPAGNVDPTLKIDPAVFGMGKDKYDVFIIGSVPRRVFGDENLKRLKARVSQGAGLIMIGGYDSFGAGGYANSPIEEMLPLKMSAQDFEIRKSKIDSDKLHYNSPLQMIPTAYGLQQMVMRIDPQGKHKERWAKLAPLEGANRLTGLVAKKKKPDGDANGENLIKPLATTPDGTPLLLAHVWNGSRVMAFGADTTYQWYLNGQQDAHQRFWRQLILYLSGKKTGDEPIWVNIDQGGKRHFGSKEDIPLRFGARDKDQKPRPHLYFHVRILGPPAKKKPQDRFSRELEVGGGKDGIAEYAIKLDPFPISGEYWIRVDAYEDKEAFRIKDGSKSIGGAWERFLIQSPDVEMSNTTPDPDTLKMISRNTGGTFIKKPQDLKAFLERLAVPEDRLQGTKPISLWDTWPLPHIPGLLLLFVLLLTTEWFIRKRRGLV